MSRWKASAIHFSVSLIVFVLLLSLILFLWYPGILFGAGGGWAGLQIVIVVDLVLGPLLTLIVFKSGKPGLKFDLSCIGVFQVVCMIGGMSIVYAERPLVLVLAYDTFFSLDSDEFQEYDLDLAKLEEIPGPYPKLVYVELPESEIAADAAFLRSQYIEDPLYTQIENYRAFPLTASEVESVFRRENSVRDYAPQRVLNELEDDCLLSKFVASVGSGFVCFNAESRRLVKFYEPDAIENVASETAE